MKMSKHTLRLLSLRLAACAGLCAAIPLTAYAGESASFTVSEAFPTHAEHENRESANFQLLGGTTWRAESPLTGASFQIIPNPPVAASSSVASSAASTQASSAAEGESEGGGGHRGETSASQAPASSQSVSSAASSTDSQASQLSISSIPVSSSGVQESSASAAEQPLPPGTTLPGTVTGSTGGGGGAGARSSVSSSAASSASVASQAGGAPCLPGRICDEEVITHPAAPVLTNSFVKQLAVIVAWASAAAGISTFSFMVFARSFMTFRTSGRPLFFWFFLPIFKREKKKEKEEDKKKNAKRRKKSSLKRKAASKLLMLFIALGMAAAFHVDTANAAESGPQKHVYNGHLLDSTGAPLATAHDIRFSYWTDADFVAGDSTATGALNTGAATYGGWAETHTVTPDANGYFSVQLGSINALPNLAGYTAAQLQSLFLQVEVKASAAPATSYELLDNDPADAAVDRSPILSVPFALNADLLDQRDVGTGSGAIPFLQSGGLLPTSTVPGGTNRDTFTIDANDDAAAPALQFGNALAKTLTYDAANMRFNFNASVRVEGNLTVTGLVNGVDVTNLQTADASHLKVSSGAGLQITVAGGSYRLRGEVTNFAGQSGVAINDNATNYVFFGSGGLTITTGGFPTDESFIPAAEVVTVGGSITSVTDRRVLQDDDREQTEERLFHAQYPDAAYEGDGADNVGQLSVLSDAASALNHYRWTSTRPTLQDFDILFRFALPADFVRWSDTPFALTYRTSSADASVSTLDISLLDTAGNPVTLSGAVTGLASAAWATTNAEFMGSPAWTAGETITIGIKTAAKDNASVDVADIRLQYVTLTGE